MLPGVMMFHGSPSVSGLVAITVTMSLGVVSFAKSTVNSASMRVASPKGALRVNQLSFVEQ